VVGAADALAEGGVDGGIGAGATRIGLQARRADLVGVVILGIRSAGRSKRVNRGVRVGRSGRSWPSSRSP